MNWHEVFEYREGALYWRIGPRNGVPVGSRAGHVNPRGYWEMKFQKKLLRQHRVIWEMHHGPIPDDLTIDHINGVKDDNRIENLRLLTLERNSQLGARRRISKELPYGVFKQKNRFRARLRRGTDRIELGSHLTVEAANIAVQEWLRANELDRAA